MKRIPRIGERARSLWRWYRERQGNRKLVILPVIGVIVLGLFWAQVAPTDTVLLLSTTALAYSVACQGLAFQYGRAGILSVAQGSIAGVGAYVASDFILDLHQSLYVAVVAAAVTSAIAAGILGLTAIRASGHHFVILTFAFAAILGVLFNNLQPLTGGDQGLVLLGSGIPETHALFYIALAMYAGVMGIVGALSRGRFGQRLYAAAQHQALADSLGIRVGRDRLMALTLSGSLAGLGGILMALTLTYVQPEIFTYKLGISFVLIVMIGGARSLFGPLLGALVVVFFPQFVTIGPYESQIAYGLLLILIVVAAPSGVAQLVGRISSPGA